MPDVTEDIEPTTAEPTTEARRPADDEAALREAGRRAIEAERQAARQATKRAKELEDELARLREATASDADKALMVARREEREKADAEWQTRFETAASSVRAAKLEAAIARKANGRFHDLDDVLNELERDASVTINDDGKIVGIDAALRDLEKRKPHWVKSGNTSPVYGGPSSGNGQPAGRDQTIDQMTEQMRANGFGVRI